MKNIAIGIMSGTSLDGIDVVITEIKGHGVNTDIDVLFARTYDYDKTLLSHIKACMDISTCRIDRLTSLNVELAYAYAKAVKKVCKESGIGLDTIDFIASHGQTIFHINEEYNDLVQSSLQLGDGSVLSQLTGCTVVSNFRQADIAVGGTGAPLVPYADYVLFSELGKTRLMQNIGGIANVTVLPKNREVSDVVAFDNGPGNLMIDCAMQVLFNQSFDDCGQVARSGMLIVPLMEELLDNDYFKMLPPKSTGRELFGNQYTLEIIKKYKSYQKEDVINTLTHFTAKAIVDSYNNFIQDYDEIIVSGGGAYNTYLMELIKAYSNKPVKTLEEIGMSSDYKEAVAFVILGNQTINKQHSNVLRATGAKQQVVLGQISYGQKVNL